VLTNVLFLTFQVNRQDHDTKQIWTPNHNSRICSKHFMDGTPTTLHPNPVLNLGNSNYTYLFHNLYYALALLYLNLVSIFK